MEHCLKKGVYIGNDVELHLNLTRVIGNDFWWLEGEGVRVKLEFEVFDIAPREGLMSTMWSDL